MNTAHDCLTIHSTSSGRKRFRDKYLFQFDWHATILLFREHQFNSQYI